MGHMPEGRRAGKDPCHKKAVLACQYDALKPGHLDLPAEEREHYTKQHAACEEHARIFASRHDIRWDTGDPLPEDYGERTAETGMGSMPEPEEDTPVAETEDVGGLLDDLTKAYEEWRSIRGKLDDIAVSVFGKKSFREVDDFFEFLHDAAESAYFMGTVVKHYESLAEKEEDDAS